MKKLSSIWIYIRYPTVYNYVFCIKGDAMSVLWTCESPPAAAGRVQAAAADP